MCSATSNPTVSEILADPALLLKLRVVDRLVEAIFVVDEEETSVIEADFEVATIAVLESPTATAHQFRLVIV